MKLYSDFYELFDYDTVIIYEGGRCVFEFLLGGNMRKGYKLFATSLAIDVLFIAFWATGAAVGFYDENLVWFFISLFGMIINAVILKTEIQDLISYIVHKAKIDDM